MKPIIVAFAGPKRVGKSTRARMLREYFSPLQPARLSFAAPVKHTVALLTGVELDAEGEYPKGAEVAPGLTFGRACQLVGKGMRDLLGENVWVNLASRRLQRDLADAALIVIDDLRYCNEADWVSAHGGLIIRLLPPAGAQVSDDGRDSAHESEQQFDKLNADITLCDTMPEVSEGSLPSSVLTAREWIEYELLQCQS